MNDPFYNQMPMGSRQEFTPYQHFGSGTGNFMADLGLNIGAGYMQNQNYVPVGFGQGGIHDRLRHQHRTDAWRTLMADRMQLQSQVIATAGTGMMGMLGDGMSEKERAALEQQIAWVGSLTPAEMVAKGSFLDRFTGGRNIVGMTDRIFNAGLYSRDPVTGATSQGASTAAVMSDAMTSRFFMREGPYGLELDPMSSYRTHGLSATELGDLYSGLARRGAFTVGDPREEMRRAARGEGSTDDQKRVMQEALSQAGISGDTSNLSEEQIDKLFDTDAGRAVLLDRHAKKATDAVAEYAGAVSALQDLFKGDGINKGIEDILKDIEDLSGGSIHRYSPAKLREMVQGMNYLSEINQFTVSETASYMGVASQMAQQRGMAGLGYDIGAYGLNIRGALSQGAVGSNIGWNSMNNEQNTEFAMNRAAAAADSPQAKRFGVLMRLYEQGQLSGDMLAAAESVKNGGSLPASVMNMSEGEFNSALAQSSNMGRGLIDQMVRDGDQQMVNRYGGVDIIAGEGQRQDARTNLTTIIGSNLEAGVDTTGMTDAQRSAAGARTGRIAAAVTDKFMDGGAEAWDRDTRYKFILDYVSSGDNADINAEVAALQERENISEKEARERYAATLTNTIGVAESELDNRTGVQGGTVNLLNQTSTEARKATAYQTEQNKLRGEVRGSLAGIASDDAMDAAMRNLIEAGVTEYTDENKPKIQRLLAESLGFEDADRVGAALEAAGNIYSTRKAALQSQLEKEKDPAQREILKEKIRAVDALQQENISIRDLYSSVDDAMADAEAEGAGGTAGAAGAQNITADRVTINVTGPLSINDGSGEVEVSGGARK